MAPLTGCRSRPARARSPPGHQLVHGERWCRTSCGDPGQTQTAGDCTRARAHAHTHTLTAEDRDNTDTTVLANVPSGCVCRTSHSIQKYAVTLIHSSFVVSQEQQLDEAELVMFSVSSYACQRRTRLDHHNVVLTVCSHSIDLTFKTCSKHDQRSPVFPASGCFVAPGGKCRAERRGRASCCIPTSCRRVEGSSTAGD